MERAQLPSNRVSSWLRGLAECYNRPEFWASELVGAWLESRPMKQCSFLDAQVSRRAGKKLLRPIAGAPNVAERASGVVVKGQSAKKCGPGVDSRVWSP